MKGNAKHLQMIKGPLPHVYRFWCKLHASALTSPFIAQNVITKLLTSPAACLPNDVQANRGIHSFELYKLLTFYFILSVSCEGKRNRLQI